MVQVNPKHAGFFGVHFAVFSQESWPTKCLTWTSTVCRISMVAFHSLAIILPTLEVQVRHLLTYGLWLHHTPTAGPSSPLKLYLDLPVPKSFKTRSMVWESKAIIPGMWEVQVKSKVCPVFGHSNTPRSQEMDSVPQSPE